MATKSKQSNRSELPRGKVTIEELTPEQAKKEAEKELQRLLDKQRAREDVRKFLSEQELLRRYGVQTARDGGSVKSKVNAAGNYTKPEMRKKLFNEIKSQAVQGTAAGQWSARKAQLLAKRYKEKGGGYKD